MNVSIYKKDKRTPDFVLGTGKMQLEELKEYADANGVIYFDLLKSTGVYDRSSGFYIKVSDYYFKKNQETQNTKTPFED